ncbi:MAG: DNA gyrase subunit A [Clostridiales bacterium]|nr:MAG: DNA gyrase subunit A [Clostridiales bacterium]
MSKAENHDTVSYENQVIVPVDLEKEMKTSYIDYAMSVIVGRALPDVRDGLKPVHRRILYAMYEDNLTSDRPFRKSATCVGDVLGRYHPHGDASVYDALVRLAQSFSLRYPLVDGHGNFGSIDGDPPAAYRYTEARMSKISNEMLRDIEKDTIDWDPNFDETRKEPHVLPARYPNLLVNGSSGIAVGMATDIPPHNLREVVAGTIALLDHPELDVDQLMDYIQGPDFPTGAVIMGRSGIRQAYRTGRGKIIVRAKAEIEEWRDGRYKIVVTEIPYMIKKSALIEKIADEVKTDRIAGISDIRDESDKDGLRFVVELKKEANPQVILNQLYKFTDMQATCSVIMLALVHNEPKILNLKQVLEQYISHQKEVICRRTAYEIKRAKARAHILEGLIKAIDAIDEVIEIIKKSASIADAKAKLMARFELDDLQAQAIVDMRLGQLSGLEREKVENEYHDLMSKIADLEDILAHDERVCAIIKEDLNEVARKFGDARRTEIGQGEIGLEDEDLIPVEDCIFTLTEAGYIKRQPTCAYKAQHRGGRGVTGMKTKEEDVVKNLFAASTHDTILFFTTKGRVYRLKGYEIPESSKIAKGTNVVNLLPLMSEERVNAMIRVENFEREGYLLMATRNGTVKKTPLSDFANIRKTGVIAILLDPEDDLIEVSMTGGEDLVMIATHNGKAIRFSEQDVRPMGRVTRGVRGIRVEEDDYVIGMCIQRPQATLLSITENGYGKRTRVEEYRVQSRGGKGISNYNITEKTGKVCAVKMVEEGEDLLLITSGGIIMRTQVEEISQLSRTTQGVRVVRLGENLKVIDIARAAREDGEESPIEEEDTQ